MKTQNEAWDVERIKELAMGKVQRSAVGAKQSATRRFRGGFAAIAAVIMLVFAGAALAVSDVIDFGARLQSIFRSEAAAPYLQTGEHITVNASEGEVEVELIAALVEASGFDVRGFSNLYVELQITDPIGGRLSDSLQLFLWDDRSGVYVPAGPIARETDIQVIDENTVRAGFVITDSLVEVEGERVIGFSILEPVVRFDLIASGIHFVQEQPTEFNIGAHIGIDSPVVVPGAEFIQITDIRLDPLDPSRLSITYQNSQYGWGWPSLSLLHTDGRVITMGGGHSGPYGVPGVHIPFRIRDIDPNDLTLVISGSVAEHTMRGSWEFAIPADAMLEGRKIEGAYGEFEMQVFLGATSVRMYLWGSAGNPLPMRIFEDTSLVLHLRDGTTIEPRFGGGDGNRPGAAGGGLAVFQYAMDFVHPDEVVRITFRGVEIAG